MFEISGDSSADRLTSLSAASKLIATRSEGTAMPAWERNMSRPFTVNDTNIAIFIPNFPFLHFHVSHFQSPPSIGHKHNRKLCKNRRTVRDTVWDVQGGPKKWGHYVWRLRSLHAHIFKMPERVWWILWIWSQPMYSEYNGVEVGQKSLKFVRAFWRCGHAKNWAFKRSGLTFFGPPCRHVWTQRTTIIN